jgi:hypothetical protein
MFVPVIESQAKPIVYADQKRRKVFVLADNRASLIPPSALQLEDKHGAKVMVPVDIQGDMTVMDVKNLSAGGYLLKVFGMAHNAIRIILF